MKRLLILLLMLVLLLGFFLYDHALRSDADTLLSHTDALRRAAENDDWDGAAGALRDLNETWNSASEQLAFFTEHAELDEIMLKKASITAYVRCREKPELLAEIGALEELLAHIPKKEELTLDNIF